jgi:hypothetical protein
VEVTKHLLIEKKNIHSFMANSEAQEPILSSFKTQPSSLY